MHSSILLIFISSLNFDISNTISNFKTQKFATQAYKIKQKTRAPSTNGSSKKNVPYSSKAKITERMIQCIKTFFIESKRCPNPKNKRAKVGWPRYDDFVGEASPNP